MAGHLLRTGSATAFEQRLARFHREILRRRRVAVWLGYGFSSLFFILVLFTDWIVGPIVTTSRAPHFAAGPCFRFVIFFIILSAGSIYNIWRACRRTITSTTRQRMRNIFLASLAAPLGVFPYLTLTGSSTEQVTVLMWLLLIVGNVLVALMFATLTANLVYFGALSSGPSRARTSLQIYGSRSADRHHRAARLCTRRPCRADPGHSIADSAGNRRRGHSDDRRMGYPCLQAAAGARVAAQQ